MHENERRAAFLRPAMGLLTLAALGAIGCWGGMFDSVERRQAFDRAIQYERWDDAIRLTEDFCNDVGPKTPQCLYQTVEAYEKRAYAHAHGEQWDTAIADELRANEAADDLVVANSAFDTSLRNAFVPEAVVDMQTRIAADRAARTRAVVQVRLDAYRNRAMPDATAVLMAQTSGVFTPYKKP